MNIERIDEIAFSAVCEFLADKSQDDFSESDVCELFKAFQKAVAISAMEVFDETIAKLKGDLK